MSRTLVAALTILACVGTPLLAGAQVYQKGLNGTLIAGAAVVPGSPGATPENPTAVTVMHTPATGFVVVTSICGNANVVRVEDFGPLATGTESGCQNMSTGIPLPQDKDVICENQGANDQRCTVSGVLVKR